MSEEKLDRRSEKGQATRQLLIEAAIRLFTEKGFEATSIEAVLASAGVSRGALYHHFSSKEALFEAVLDAMEARVAEKLLEEAAKHTDPVESLRAGAKLWLSMTRDPAIKRITLIDAPAVLGWQRWREIDERHGFGLLKAALGAVAAQGKIPEAMVDSFAHMLLAVMAEAALLIAKSGDDDSAVASGEAAVLEFLDRLLAPRVSATE